KPAQPWLSALSLFGLGVAGAVGPYLTVTLRDLDPRIPFAVSSLALALATIGILWAQRALAATAGPSTTSSATTAPPLSSASSFLVAVALVGVAFQIHFSVNSAPLYPRHAKPVELPYLMPVFWIGFSLLMLPASAATKRFGGIAVMGCGAIVGALASGLSFAMDNLRALLVLQFLAGGAWGCVLMSAVAAGLHFGHTGREGKVTGAPFALLAAAAAGRLVMVIARLPQDTSYAVLLQWLPTAAWAAGGAILLWFWAVRLRRAEVLAT